MEKFYHSFGQLIVLSQLLLWVLAFYWIDSEILSGIISNMKFPNNSLFLLIVISSQILFFRNFYYAVKIHSFAKDTPFNFIEQQESLTHCKKCNILRKERAHHCRYCNKCIEVMDHHCFSLNNCIGEKNYHYFIGYILLVEINSTIIFCSTLYKLIYYFNKINVIFRVKYGAIVLISCPLSISMFFLLCFNIYLSLTNLTTLEFNYKNLRVIEEKKENNDKKRVNNLIEVLQKVLRLFCP